MRFLCISFSRPRNKKKKKIKYTRIYILKKKITIRIKNRAIGQNQIKIACVYARSRIYTLRFSLKSGYLFFEGKKCYIADRGEILYRVSIHYITEKYAFHRDK